MGQTAYIHTYILTYIHTALYLYTYMYVYIHTYIFKRSIWAGVPTISLGGGKDMPARAAESISETMDSDMVGYFMLLYVCMYVCKYIKVS